MGTGIILQIVLVAAGILVMMETVLSLSQRKLREQFCVLWGIVSVLLVVSGIFLRPTVWGQYISETGTILVILSALCLIGCLFFLSVHISVLGRKTQELAMHVSLLNHENERILAELERLVGEKEKDGPEMR